MELHEEVTQMLAVPTPTISLNQHVRMATEGARYHQLSEEEKASILLADSSVRIPASLASGQLQH